MKSFSHQSIAALVTLSLFSGMTTSYADTWFKPYQDTLTNQKIMTADYLKFADNVIVTADFLILLVKAVDPSTRAEQFSDLAVLQDKANALGLILEVDEVTHYMDKSLPRELAVQLLSRALDIKGEKVTADPRLSVKFKDFGIVNDINREALLKTYQLGIVKGDSKGNFGAKNLVTKAEAVTLIAKLMDKKLRTQLVVIKNTKKYNDVAEWYIEQFEKTVTSKPVVIEKKANGVLNSGDVDYTEKAFYYNGKWNNWWTDQEFEDRILGDMSKRNSEIKSTAFYSDEMVDVKSGQGNFIPHNGELMYTLHEDARDGKALKFYDHPVKNMNRISYDLTKYTTQIGLMRGEYSFTFTNRTCITHALDNVGTPSGGVLMFDFYLEPNIQKFRVDNKFTPDWRLRMSDEQVKRYKPLIEQVFIRLYGVKDGQAMFKEIQVLVKGRDGLSKGEAYKVVNGYKIFMHDVDFSFPIFEMTLKK